ncbi:MAG: energy transducer TonB [Verrucomicrobiota bacterium]|nr:energy transducer TonB [Verrucomicrobiota bacterium]
MRVSPVLRVFALAFVVLAGLGQLAKAQRPDELAKIAVKVVPPEYPYEARRSGITGKGIVAAEVDYTGGKVTSVKMEKSTGSRILDQAVLNAFGQWQFKPKTIRRFRTPVTYEMARSREDAMERIRSMQEADKKRSR